MRYRRLESHIQTKVWVLFWVTMNTLYLNVPAVDLFLQTLPSCHSCVKRKI